ncbi:MAG: DUF3604 domain-containing protein [Myxococcota bacterium]
MFIGSLTITVSGWALSTPNDAPADRCDHYLSDRQAFFGDLHVHTALSLDAATQETRTRPDEAYAFAMGEPLSVQPFDEKGQGTRTLQLERPLDFAAVTDHAELLGEVEICSNPDLEGYASLTCRMYRNRPRAAFFWMNMRMSFGKSMRLCGPGRLRCQSASQRPWDEIQAAAAAWNRDTGDCDFTTFVGYEWTGARDGKNLHRNVIFRGADVPALPIDFYAAPAAPELWAKLNDQCTGDCDFIVIPHNSNLSDGQMFLAPTTATEARIRADAERLVEIMQHKGASECWPGSPDEHCGFEALPYRTFTEKFTAFRPKPPGPSVGWVRPTLTAGLRFEADLGVNPYVFGLIGSTDTHLGAPGLAAEEGFPGHGGAGRPADASVRMPDDVEFNPGGLVGVWAEENSRDSLFTAMKRRETFATSGPRMQVRLFAGDLEDDLCDRPNRIGHLYQTAAPMGSTIDAPAAMRLLVEASADPRSRPLQQVQIVKGWLDGDAPREQVFDAIVAETPGAVDPDTCEASGGGATVLCTVWTDPTYDPAERAVYYARILEAPSCRWSQRLCRAHDVQCDGTDASVGGMEACCAETHQPIVQERAWSSPIWVRP